MPRLVIVLVGKLDIHAVALTNRVVATSHRSIFLRQIEVISPLRELAFSTSRFDNQQQNSQSVRADFCTILGNIMRMTQEVEKLEAEAEAKQRANS